jgi:chemotaxis protein MotB
VKRHKVAHHENHERWLVSYADFITLMFAFFVVMFATAQQDKTKAHQVAESVREALRHGQLSSTLEGIINQRRVVPEGKGDSRRNPATSPPQATPDNTPLASQADLHKAAETLNRSLEKELKTGELLVQVDRRGLVISLREAGFFASGDDRVNASSFPIIEKIAAVIGPLHNPLRLEGHTDSVPIHNARFQSNWELSTARGIAMLETLRERYHVPSERMSVAGFAENAPADTNETAEGRMHNRRVDVVVLSAEALRGEPPPVPPKS